jgi:dTDP-4-dehydrorhamnose 3,5-epimerase-like enzyme
MTNPTLKTRGCRWISVPGAADARGQVNFLSFDDKLGFVPKRLFWLHHIAPGQWRGRHGHRESHLVTLLLNGSCKVHLDDGKVKETVVLDDPSQAVHIGPLVWHELTDFTPQAVILVIASTLYDEAEYLRDYETFKRVSAGRTT